MNFKYFLMLLKSAIESAVIGLAIMAIWYYNEYKEFGQLQLDRQCDNIVMFIFIGTICLILYVMYRLEDTMKKKIINAIDARIEENERQQQFFKEMGDTITARQFYFMIKEAEAIRAMIDKEFDD